MILEPLKLVSMHLWKLPTLSFTTSRTNPYVEQANLNSIQGWKPSLVTVSVVRGQPNHRVSPGGGGLAQTANPDNERQNRHGKRQAVDAVSLRTTDDLYSD